MFFVFCTERVLRRETEVINTMPLTTERPIQGDNKDRMDTACAYQLSNCVLLLTYPRALKRITMGISVLMYGRAATI